MWSFKEKIRSFTWDEMACKNCPHCGGVSDMDESFMIKLQELRDACGFPLPVNSGYRCMQKNIDCKGHVNSGHLDQGDGAMACDLRVERNKARVVIQKAIEMGFSVGISQSGKSGRFVHVDTKPRKSGNKNLWSYS
jgi:zinc D-Ala-D-Ala carboxypeptidase